LKGSNFILMDLQSFTSLHNWLIDGYFFEAIRPQGTGGIGFSDQINQEYFEEILTRIERGRPAIVEKHAQIAKKHTPIAGEHATIERAPPLIERVHATID
jgi:hypothetical protein